MAPCDVPIMSLAAVADGVGDVEAAKSITGSEVLVTVSRATRLAVTAADAATAPAMRSWNARQNDAVVDRALIARL